MDNTVRQRPPVTLSTSNSKFCSFWRQGQEFILSSISKMHNGHYIAATTSSLLSTVFSTLSSVPWELGVILRRWTRSLNVALEKKPGVRLLSSLCTIHMLKADFNTSTKQIFAQRTMDNALQAEQMPESQCAKKRSHAIEVVLLKRHYYDYLRITKTPEWLFLTTQGDVLTGCC